MLVALTSSSIVCAEVLLTRLLSLSTWYGLAFLVLSLAMLGLCAGSLSAARAKEKGIALGPYVANGLLRFGIGLVFATAIVCTVPVSFSPDLTSFGSVVLVAAALT